LCPSPSWFSRRQSPLFGRCERAIDEGLAPVQAMVPIQLRQEGPPDLQPHSLFLPPIQTAPAGRGTGVFLGIGQRLPLSPSAQNPEDSFQTLPILRPRPASAILAARQWRQERLNLRPSSIGQLRSQSHRPSLPGWGELLRGRPLEPSVL
jgi:hypothetical protein